MATATIKRLTYDTGTATSLHTEGRTTVFKTPNNRYFFFIDTAGLVVPPSFRVLKTTTAAGALAFLLRHNVTAADAEFPLAAA